MISGEFGPFRPNRKVKVPAWLAFMLRKKHMCSIVPPDYMDPDKLQEVRIIGY